MLKRSDVRFEKKWISTVKKGEQPVLTGIIWLRFSESLGKISEDEAKKRIYFRIWELVYGELKEPLKRIETTLAWPGLEKHREDSLKTCRYLLQKIGSNSYKDLCNFPGCGRLAVMGNLCNHHYNQ